MRSRVSPVLPPQAKKRLKEKDTQPTAMHRDRMDLRAKGEAQAAGSTRYPKIVRSYNTERGRFSQLLLGDLSSLTLTSGTTGEEESVSKETRRVSQL